MYHMISVTKYVPWRQQLVLDTERWVQGSRTETKHAASWEAPKHQFPGVCVCSFLRLLCGILEWAIHPLLRRSIKVPGSLLGESS